MARILIIGGGCRGLGLTRALIERGDAVRVTTRTGARRGAIEESGAECWIGTPERLATLTGALGGVAIVCWLLARLDGEAEDARALHGPRLQSFLAETVDTGVRGFVYECSAGALPPDVLQAGTLSVARMSEQNAIRWALIEAPLEEDRAWTRNAMAAIDALLGESSTGSPTPLY